MLNEIRAMLRLRRRQRDSTHLHIDTELGQRHTAHLIHSLKRLLIDDSSWLTQLTGPERHNLYKLWFTNGTHWTPQNNHWHIITGANQTYAEYQFLLQTSFKCVNFCDGFTGSPNKNSHILILLFYILDLKTVTTMGNASVTDSLNWMCLRSREVQRLNLSCIDIDIPEKVSNWVHLSHSCHQHDETSQTA